MKNPSSDHAIHLPPFQEKQESARRKKGEEAAAAAAARKRKERCRHTTSGSLLFFGNPADVSGYENENGVPNEIFEEDKKQFSHGNDDKDKVDEDSEKQEHWNGNLDHRWRFFLTELKVG